MMVNTPEQRTEERGTYVSPKERDTAAHTYDPRLGGWGHPRAQRVRSATSGLLCAARGCG